MGPQPILDLREVVFVLTHGQLSSWPLFEDLMITNQGYWLLMVKIELSDRLKLIKH